jgi:hypothetical protein
MPPQQGAYFFWASVSIMSGSSDDGLEAKAMVLDASVAGHQLFNNLFCDHFYMPGTVCPGPGFGGAEATL